MIKVCCKTNLDKFQRERWPTEFAVEPRIGDLVRSDSGKILKITGRTHRMSHNWNSIHEPEPIIELYLDRPITGIKSKSF